VEEAPYVAVPKLARGEFPRPAVLKPELPAELDAIVMRALAVNRDERYESSNAFGDALAEFLYSTTPRFSALSLSHFVQELFREDLTSTGHEVQVPPSFREQLAQWRGGLSTAATSSGMPLTPSSPTSPAPSVQPPEPPARKALYVGVGVGAALLASALTALLFIKGAEPVAVADPSKPQPVPHHGPARPPPVEPVPPPIAAAPVPSEPQPPSVDTAPAANTPEPAAQQEPEAPHVRASASYPVEAIRLDARQDVINIGALTEKIPLEPGATYRLSEPKPPRDSSPLFFWLSGSDLRANDGVGVLSQRPIQVKGAAELKIFLLSPLLAGAAPREVQLENVQTKNRQRIAVTLGTSADMERAFELKNLDPASTYELTLVPIENGAYTRGEHAGPLEQVGCVRLPAQGTASEEELSAAQKDPQFLLTTHASTSLSHASSLLCGFIDDDPTDNQGEVKIWITRRSGGPEWTHPSLYSLAAPNKAGEVQSAFEQALRLFNEKQYDGAAIFSERCISLEPNDADCHLLAGATYASIPGRSDKATSHYQLFLSLAPNHALAISVRRDLAQLAQQKSP
jgi:serine/threonine-protein kinase